MTCAAIISLSLSSSGYHQPQGTARITERSSFKRKETITAFELVTFCILRLNW